MPNLHLTEMFDPEVERGWSETSSGMAHLAGSGPTGSTCVDCVHLDLEKDSKTEKARCHKYKELMRCLGKKFSKRSAACRYFEVSLI